MPRCPSAHGQQRCFAQFCVAARDHDSNVELAHGSHDHACMTGVAQACDTKHCHSPTMSAPEQSSAAAATACGHSHQQHAASLACHEDQRNDDAAPLMAHRHRSYCDAHNSTNAVGCSNSPTSLASTCDSDACSTDELFEVVIIGACPVMASRIALCACMWCTA
jgi:hypothetical protein